MKGLLIKDIKLISKNKLFLICIVLVMLILCTTTGSRNHGMVIGYVTMLCTMLVLTTMSFDEQNNTLAFLMTLPATRREYVREKYILMFCCAFLGVAFGATVCFFWDRNNREEIFVEAAAVFLAIVFLQLIMLPLQFKFGVEKGRIAFIIMAGAFSGTAIAARKILNPTSAFWAGAAQFVYGIAEWFLSLGLWMTAALAAAFFLFCTAISALISTRIMCRKEF